MSQSTQKQPIKWKNDNNFTEQNVIEESIQFEEERKLQAMSLKVAEQMQEKEVLKYTAYIAKDQGDLEEQKESEHLNVSKVKVQEELQSQNIINRSNLNIQPQDLQLPIDSYLQLPIDSYSRIDGLNRQRNEIENDEAIANALQAEEYNGIGR